MSKKLYLNRLDDIIMYLAGNVPTEEVSSGLDSLPEALSVLDVEPKSRQAHIVAISKLNKTITMLTEIRDDIRTSNKVLDGENRIRTGTKVP